MKSEKFIEVGKKNYKLVTEIYEGGIKCAAEISRKTSIPARSVSRLIALWKSGTPVEEIKSVGRPAKITPKNKSYMCSEISKTPHLSSRDLQRKLSEKKSVEVSNVFNTGVGPDCSEPPPGCRIFELFTKKRADSDNYTGKHSFGVVHKTLDVRLEFRCFHGRDIYLMWRPRTKMWHKKGRRPIRAKAKFPMKLMFWSAISVEKKFELVPVSGKFLFKKNLPRFNDV